MSNEQIETTLKGIPAYFESDQVFVFNPNALKKQKVEEEELPEWLLPKVILLELRESGDIPYWCIKDGSNSDTKFSKEDIQLLTIIKDSQDMIAGSSSVLNDLEGNSSRKKMGEAPLNRDLYFKAVEAMAFITCNGIKDKKFQDITVPDRRFRYKEVFGSDFKFENVKGWKRVTSIEATTMTRKTPCTLLVHSSWN